MELDTEVRPIHRYETWTAWPVSWTAVWVGTLTAITVALIIGLIGIAVGAHELGTDAGGIDEHVRRVGPHAERVDVRVLEQEQVVVVAASPQGVLEGERVSVAHATEPADPQHAYSSWAQSLVSRISLSRATNADAYAPS